MAPLISILIPAYNAARWIGGTLRSAINQTWPRTEIIVVDDGSRDETLAVARQFASRKVSVVSKRNEGAAAARNHAFSLCQGDFIQWLDADDLLAPDKIEQQMRVVQRLREPRTLLSAGWGRFAHRPGRARFVPTPLWQDLAPVEWLLFKMSRNLYMQTATWLASRELTVATGSWNSELLSDDDGEYFTRALVMSNGVRFVAESKVYYRDAAVGRLSYIGASGKQMEALLASMKLHVRYLRSLEDSERVRLACLAYVRNWATAIAPDRGDLLDELSKMAVNLGGFVDPPRLRRKYAWMAPMIGRSAAWRAQLMLPRVKARVTCGIDRFISMLDSRSLSQWQDARVLTRRSPE